MKRLNKRVIVLVRFQEDSLTHLRNNVMQGSDFHRLILSDEYCATNGIFIHFSLTNITIEKYFNKIKCCFESNPQNNITISSIKSINTQDSIVISVNSYSINVFAIRF